MLRLTYSLLAPPEQPKEQYARKSLPTVPEPVLLPLSRNQRYQDAVLYPPVSPSRNHFWVVRSSVAYSSCGALPLWSTACGSPT